MASSRDSSNLASTILGGLNQIPWQTLIYSSLANNKIFSHW